MKKILFIPGIVEQTVGGAELQMRFLAEELAKIGYDIYGVQLNLPDGIKPLYKNLFLRNSYIGKKIKARSFFLKKVYDYILKVQPDIVYQRGELPYIAPAVYYCKSHSAKSVWHISHDRLVEKYFFNLFKESAFEPLENAARAYGIKHVDLVISQTHHQSKMLQKNYNRQANQIIANFHPKPEEEIKKKPTLQIIWIANFKEWKQPELFIQLASGLQNYDDIEFIMIGRSADNNWMENIKKQMDTTPNLKWFGSLSVEEVNQVLATSHIFVNTSTYEGFPNTFIQAWMRKVPVLSLNADIDGILEKGKVGFICHTFENLLERTRFLIENNNTRNQMGEVAQKYAIDNFSIETNIPKLISIFAE